MDTYQSEHLKTQDYAPFFSFLALTKIFLKTLEKCTREKIRLGRLDEETVERETEAGRKARDKERRAQRRGEKVTAVTAQRSEKRSASWRDDAREKRY